VDFPAVQVPSTGGTYSLSAGTYGGTNYTYLLNNANYYASSGITMAGTTMGVAGNVTLYVNGDFTTTSTTYIYLYPGANLKLYIGGAMSMAGQGIINGTGLASQLTVYGTSTTTQTWSYAGNALFVGTIYAPNANFTFSGNAGAVGSFTGNTVTITGGAGIHYDENLSKAFKGYLVTSWNEI
jgi:hypothetical protein